MSKQLLKKHTRQTFNKTSFNKTQSLCKTVSHLSLEVPKGNPFSQEFKKRISKTPFHDSILSSHHIINITSPKISRAINSQKTRCCQVASLKDGIPPKQTHPLWLRNQFYVHATQLLMTYPSLKRVNCELHSSNS